MRRRLHRSAGGVALPRFASVAALAAVAGLLGAPGWGTALTPGAGSSALLGPVARTSSPTYVILVHGWDPSTQPATYVWTYGVDLYQQLVNAGYVVGVVTYYGTFTLAFSNGTTWSDPAFYGTTSTPIESIGLELGRMLDRAFPPTGTATLDLIGHSMGGLVTQAMLEHVRLPGVAVRNVIYLGSPLNGAPVTYLTPWLNLSGYQAAEMAEGSPFLTSLHAGVPEARQHAPGAVWIDYAGDADPYWAATYFSGHPNDGLVEVPSAEFLLHDHAYLFPDLHIPNLDVYTPGSVSYFEDPGLASRMLGNLAGQY